MSFEVTSLEGPSSFSAQEDALQTKIDEIKKRYEPRIQQLKEDGEKIRDDVGNPDDIEAVINVDFEVTWKDQRLVFDYPEIRMRDQRISFDVPEVRMNLQRIIFDVPAVRMVAKKVGQYPEIHGFTLKWKDIIMHVPETYMQRNEIKLDLPSVTMRRQDIVLGLPEVRMEQMSWIIGLPQFKVINVQAATENLQRRGNSLQEEGQAISAAMSAEINAAVADFLKGAGGVANTVDSTRGAFDAALSSVKTSIDLLQQRGVDPIKVPTDHGNVNLRAMFAELLSNRDEVMPKLEQLSVPTQAETLATEPALVEA